MHLRSGEGHVAGAVGPRCGQLHLKQLTLNSNKWVKMSVQRSHNSPGKPNIAKPLVRSWHLNKNLPYFASTAPIGAVLNEHRFLRKKKRAWPLPHQWCGRAAQRRLG